MKAHIEIKIKIKKLPKDGLHEILREFARETPGWEFAEDKSRDYQDGHGSAAGFAVCLPRETLECAAVAIANLDPKHLNTFQVPNIVPRESSSLTLAQYNAVGMAFAEEFRRWLKSTLWSGTVETTGPEMTLAEIIPGPKTRGFFEAWLHTPTPLSHPSDLYALDVFICYLFRHRGKTKIWQIAPYLVEDLHWKRDAAEVAVARIASGLELLRVDRKF